MTVLGRERVAFALVANCDPYSYAGRMPLRIAPEARFELGPRPRRPAALEPWLLPQCGALGTDRPGPGRRRTSSTSTTLDELRIECDGPTPLQVDGEDLGDVEECALESERDALTVLVRG